MLYPYNKLSRVFMKHSNYGSCYEHAEKTWSATVSYSSVHAKRL